MLSSTSRGFPLRRCPPSPASPAFPICSSSRRTARRAVPTAPATRLASMIKQAWPSLRAVVVGASISGALARGQGRPQLAVATAASAGRLPTMVRPVRICRGGRTMPPKSARRLRRPWTGYSRADGRRQRCMSTIMVRTSSLRCAALRGATAHERPRWTSCSVRARLLICTTWCATRC